MSTQIDRPGNFQAEIVGYGLNEWESGAVSLRIHARLTAQYEDNEWKDWTQYDVEATGDLWIVKKDGSLNQSQITSLMKCANWDGSFNSITHQTWKPIPCQVVINRDEYEGQERFRIAFVNEFDRVPGQLSNVDEEKTKLLESKYGAQMRALFGNQRRNNSQPAVSKPQAPPRKSEVVSAGKTGDDDIPF